MKIEDVIAWQKANLLNEELKRVLVLVEDVTLKIQIQRASLSIINNIIEAFERTNKKETIFYLYEAKSACVALNSKVNSLKLIYFVNLTTFEISFLLKLIIEVSTLITELITFVKFK